MCNYEQNKYRGFVKTFRSMLEWQWFRCPNTSHLFQALLLLANHKDNYFGKVLVKRGELITSVQNLAERSGLSVSQVRTALKNLQDTNEIDIKATNKFTSIIINNYDLYQGDEIVDNKQTAIKSQSNNNQIATNNNDNNDKNDKNIYRVTKKVFVPPTLEEVKQYCIERNNNVDATTWFDFYQSKDWLIGKNKMKDWKASVRTWERSRSPVATKPAPSYRYETNNQIKWG